MAIIMSHPPDDKPTLLLIHGLIGSLRYFDPADRLPRVAVVAPDLLGYGAHRDEPAAALTLAGQAAHVQRVLAALSAPRVWLLGHSMGGAVAMLVADALPNRVAGLINVEGNFTLADAFWSRRVAAESPADWADRWQSYQADVRAWLDRLAIAPTAANLAAATHVLGHQPAETVQAMSRALMRETATSGYTATVERVAASGIPLHLIAGERSAAAWDVPVCVRSAARSDHVIPGTGHLMMLEAPAAFCALVAGILAGE